MDDAVTLQSVRIGTHFAVTPTGLDITGEPTFGECESLWDQLLTMEKSIQFAIGDAMRYFNARWGEEKASQIISARTGWTFETLRNYEWVADKVPAPVRRLDKLTFTHHQLVAACSPPEQEAWLNKAADSEDEPWTTDKLKSALKVSGGVAVAAYWLMVRCDSEEAREALKDRLEREGYSCKPSDEHKKTEAAA